MPFFSFRQPRLHGAPHDWQQGWNRRLLGLPLPEIHRQVLNGFKLTPAITAFSVTPTQFILDTLRRACRKKNCHTVSLLCNLRAKSFKNVKLKFCMGSRLVFNSDLSSSQVAVGGREDACSPANRKVFPCPQWPLQGVRGSVQLGYVPHTSPLDAQAQPHRSHLPLHGRVLRQLLLQQWGFGLGDAAAKLETVRGPKR